MRVIQRDCWRVYLRNDGHILLGQSIPGGVHPGFTMVPGGGIDEGETKEEAIKREILEEVGIDIADATTELVNDTQSGESEKTLRDTGERVLVHMHYNDFRIILPKPASDIPIRTDDDFTNAKWVPITDLPALHLTDPTKHTLRKMGYL